MIKPLVLLVTSLCFIAPAFVAAEQKKVFGEYEVHYIVVPTTFLNAKIATQYNLPRGKDRALINVSVLHRDQPVTAEVAGDTRNLLEQLQQLEFTEVREQTAVYYLAIMRHADEEHHRLRLNVTLPNGETKSISFQQKMYWQH